jgi:hypothetical protein
MRFSKSDCGAAFTAARAPRACRISMIEIQVKRLIGSNHIQSKELLGEREE